MFPGVKKNFQQPTTSNDPTLRPIKDQALQAIANDHRNPFKVLIADKVEDINSCDIPEINGTIRNRLSSAIQEISRAIHSKNPGSTTDNKSYWIMILGDTGSGKTHLLKWFEKEAHDKKVFFLNPNPFEDKGPVEHYLAQSLLNAFIVKPFPGEKINALPSMAFHLFQTAIRTILESGNPNWGKQLLRPQRFLLFFQKLYDSDKRREELLKKIETSEGLAEILGEFDQSLLVDETLNTFIGSIKPDFRKIFRDLLQLSFGGRSEENNSILLSLEEDVSSKSKLLDALLSLISLSKKMVCLSLDQFEDTFTPLKMQNTDLKSLRREVKALFNGYEKFRDRSEGFILLQTCQLSDWEDQDQSIGLSTMLHKSSLDRIYTLKCPNISPHCIEDLIKQRMDNFWREVNFDPPTYEDFLFPFYKEEIESLKKSNLMTIRGILQTLEESFREKMEFIETGSSINGLVQFLRDQTYHKPCGKSSSSPKAVKTPPTKVPVPTNSPATPVVQNTPPVVQSTLPVIQSATSSAPSKNITSAPPISIKQKNSYNYDRIFNRYPALVKIADVRTEMKNIKPNSNPPDSEKIPTLEYLFDHFSHQQIIKIIDNLSNKSALEERCKEYNLSTKGSKIDLIKRILES